MNQDDYFHYTLNGIEHHIIRNTTNRIIEKTPLDNQLLISQKCLLKYIHDFFTYKSIDYFISNHTLFGYHLFQGIHIYHPYLEICIPYHSYQILIHHKDEIIEDGFEWKEEDEYICIENVFFDKKKVKCYLYKLSSPEESFSDVSHIYFENIKTNQKKTISYNLYDIYPLTKKRYEEFEIYCPKKINEILEKENFNLEYICFRDMPNENDSLSSFIPPSIPFLSTTQISESKREMIEETNDHKENIMDHFLSDPYETVIDQFQKINPLSYFFTS